MGAVQYIAIAIERMPIDQCLQSPQVSVWAE